MNQNRMAEPISRRDLLRTGALLPAGLYRAATQKQAARTPPPYTLSINIEIMFRATKLTEPTASARRRSGFQGVQLLERDRRRAQSDAEGAEANGAHLRQPRRHRPSRWDDRVHDSRRCRHAA